MKKIIFLTSILVATFYGNSQMSVYDCEVSTEVITQSTIENFVGDFHRGCIDLGVPQNFNFNGNFSKNIFATKEILLRDGFFAGDFNQFGGILLKIKPRIDYDVALIDYGDLNSIRRLEKLELGLSIPTDLQTKIHNYVTEQVVPPSQKLNPFWDTDIRVFGEFKHSSSGDEIFIDGFYTRDFESVIFDTPIPPDNLASGYNHEEYYSKTGYYEEIETEYPFRVRFAPPKNGLWQCRIFVQVNGQTIHITPQFDFTVVESGKKGYVKAGNRYFMQDEKTFFPLGCNLPNPEHNSIWDPEIAPYLRNFNGDLGTSAYDSRREIPRSYRAYKEAMTALADNGANFFRIIMFPNSNDIEYEKLGNYYDRMNMAMEMDKILEKAEELDLYVRWNMQIHFNFQKSADAYHRRWTWDDTGMVYCYRALVDSDNSQLFFTHEESKAAYKQRLRYILARWGYSTHIAMFELFSEINSLGSPDGKSGDYEQNISFRNAIGEWHNEMSTYLKQHYYGKKHLIGPSYVRSRRRLGDFTTSFNSIDFASCNWYVWGYPDYHKNFNEGLTEGMSTNPDDDGFYPEGEFSMFGGFGIKPFFASEAEAMNMKCHIGNGPAQYAPHPVE